MSDEETIVKPVNGPLNSVLAELGQWARARGIPKPQTQEGMQKLFAQYMAEQIQEPAGPAWDEVNDRPTHLLWNGANTQIVDESKGPAYDDFEELVANREKALHEAGGDDLARDVILREKTEQAYNAAVPFSRSTPKTMLNGVMGSTISVKIPKTGSLVDAITNAQTVARWIGEDADSQSVTVTLSVGYPLTAFAGDGSQTVRPFAYVQFGTRSSASQVEVDVGVGCQFTVTCNHISLQMGFESSSGSPQKTYTLTGMLNFGTPIRTKNITRTRYLATIVHGGGASPTSAIPPFARTIEALYNSTGASFGATTQIFFYDANGNTFSSADGPFTFPITFPGDAAQFSITNNDGAIDLQTPSVVFGLGL